MTVEDIKNKILEITKMIDIESTQNHGMLIGEEFHIKQPLDIVKDTLLSLLKWIEENEKRSGT